MIEIDAASNRGIDQIRELREMVRYAPAASRSKVVILDEAHMLTGEASNALLKTLEEPPERVIFVMATTQPEDLEDTIRSRSQHFHFRALTFNEITDRLKYIASKENLKIEDGALAVIARMAEGSMRDALSLLEQARAYCGDNIQDQAVRDLLGVVPEDALNELVQAIAEQSAERALGPITIAVANAGIYPNRTVLDLTVEEWDCVIETNMRGVFLTCQAAARSMTAGALAAKSSRFPPGPTPAAGSAPRTTAPRKPAS